MDPERLLLARAAAGDENAFRILWLEHRDAVYAFSCWTLQDSAAAEDVVQDCFLALLEHPKRFDPARASLRTFLLGIARNQCRNRWRKFASEVELDEPDNDAGAPQSTLDHIVSTEENAILNAAVAALPASLQREALFLFEYEADSPSRTPQQWRISTSEP